MYKVFVSSTYIDLKEYRESVKQTLREMKFEDVAMEYFTAADQRSVDKCLSEVASCDLYIGIFAWRYGHIPPGETRSITELEYRKAVATGKECLIFLVDNGKPWLPEYIDKGDNYSKLESLKSELSNKHVRKFFETPEDLANKVSTAVHNWELKIYSAHKKEPKLTISNYSKIIYSKYRTLDLDTLTPSTPELDLRIQLKNIFIEPNVRESLPPMELPKEVYQKIQDEWNIDKECFPEGLDVYDIKKEAELYYSKIPSPVLDVIANEGNEPLVILGDPGSGKSTLSKYILLSILGFNQDSKLNKRFDSYLPLLIELRDFVSLCSKKECKNFLDYYQYLGEVQGYNLTREEINSYLVNDGRSLVIFDGLDEIFDPIEWNRVNQMIVGFNVAYPKVKVIVTSRIVGYNRKMFLDAGFKHFTIQDFENDQINKFLDKWYSIVMYDNQEESKNRKRRIVKALKESNSIRQLAGNPLLLTILAIISRHQELPKERWELYNHATGVLVQRWDVNRNLKNTCVDAEYIDEKDKKELLRRIAFKMQSGPDGLAGNFIHLDTLQKIIEEYLFERFRVDHGNAKIIAKYIIDQLRKRNFILCLYGADFFGFIHRTFLEYFCSSAIVEKFNDHEIDIDSLKEQFYSKYWENKTWHEVLRLICGMKEKIAGDLIEYLIDLYHPKFYDNRLPWNIVLAIKCLSEVRNLESVNEPSKKLLQRILELFEIAPDNINISSFLAEEIVPSAKTLGINWPNHNFLADWISRSSTFALKTQGINSILSNLWADFVADIGSDSESIYIAIEKKLYCDNKSKCLAILALGKFHSRRETIRTILINSTLNNEDSEVRISAVQALAANWNNDPEILYLFKGFARNDKDIAIRNRAVKVLARNWNSNPEILELIKDYSKNDKDVEVRSSAIEALAMNWRNNPDILELIKKYAGNDKDIKVRSSAIQALAMNWNSSSEVLELIKDYARNDKDVEVRSSAIQALARNWRNNPDILEIIKEYAGNDKNIKVRSSAIQTLAMNWNSDPEALNLVKKYIQSNKDQFEDIILVSILTIHWNNDSQIIELIKEYIKHGNSNIIRIVAISLLAINLCDNPDILELIKEYAKNDKDVEVRSSAIQALAMNWNSNSEILELIKDYAKNDKDVEIRSSSIEALARNWKNSPEILELIKNYARNDKDIKVRSNAIQTLSRNWEKNSEIVEIIKDYAKNDKDIEVRNKAVKVLAMNWNSNSEILELIKDYARNDKDVEVRSSAIQALARNWRNNPDILELIKKYAGNDKDIEVRNRAVKALAMNWNSNSEILELIKDYAKNDKDVEVRSSAIEALARNWRNNSEILEVIKEYARNDKDIKVRSSAVQALAMNWNSNSEILELIKDYAKNDKDVEVRSSAIQALVMN